MNIRIRLKAAIYALLAMCVFVHPAFGQEQPADTPKLIIFYSPACHRCAEAKTKIMPEVEKRFRGRIAVEYRDITEIDNYKFMLGLEEKYGVKIKNIVPVFFFEGGFVNGEGRIRDNLTRLISKSLNKLSPQGGICAEIDLVTHFKSFKPLAVIGAGLVDGINPCAFTVIVFFISFLALQGYRKRELIFIGLSFIFAVFLTYLLIGVGLFGFLYRCGGFWAAAKIINSSIGAFSIILGILALYDFFKFKATGKTEGLALQLPQAVKNRIHAVIGMHFRAHKQGEAVVLRAGVLRLSASALITGFLVSILEAVCTGQVYLPTIAFVLKSTSLKLQAFGYLLLYNLMFIAPLFIIFILALWGVSSEEFSRALKRHLLGIKILMAFLFFGLGILLIWR